MREKDRSCLSCQSTMTTPSFLFFFISYYGVVTNCWRPQQYNVFCCVHRSRYSNYISQSYGSKWTIEGNNFNRDEKICLHVSKTHHINNVLGDLSTFHHEKVTNFNELNGSFLFFLWWTNINWCVIISWNEDETCFPKLFATKQSRKCSVQMDSVPLMPPIRQSMAFRYHRLLNRVQPCIM